MHPVINIALRAARSAAEQISHQVDRLDRVTVVEDNAQGLLTSMDIDAERSILYHLQKAYPDYGVFSRISGLTEGADADNTWLIDPLVGNRNYIRGFPGFCVSLALKSRNVISHAIIINPMSSQEFTASRGNGAQLNGSRIRVGQRRTLEKGLTTLDVDASNGTETAVALQAALLNAGSEVRTSGCPALDMAYSAAGRIDAGWCMAQHETTLAAAKLILQESGALLSDPAGNPLTTGSKELLYGSPKCFKELIQLRQQITKQQ
jgi:myo-inositol-1(or 4)-monophosphatase